MPFPLDPKLCFKHLIILFDGLKTAMGYRFEQPNQGSGSLGLKKQQIRQSNHKKRYEERAPQTDNYTYKAA